VPHEYAELLGYAEDDLTRHTGRQAGPEPLIFWRAEHPLNASLVGLPEVVFPLHPTFVEVLE
jgi:hypothetical protein